MRFLPTLLFGALALGSTAAFSQARETVSPNEAQGPAYTPQPYAPAPNALQDQRALLVTHPGGGAGGADESRLQTVSVVPAMNTIGFGVQQTAPNRIADDFVIPAGGYTVTSFTVYSYQTGSTTTPTHNGITLQIWNGPPGAMGSSVVFGDTTTNRFTSAAFSNIFRTTETAVGATNRPIMAVTASGLNINLPAGTYWLDFALSGTLASGPWAPPITIQGSSAPGNGLQSITGVWGPALDGGAAAVQQGFPLTIDGIPPGTDVALTLTDAPDPVNAGGSITYTATATNNGPIGADGIVINLPLPAGTTFVSATPSAGGVCNAASPVVCTFAGTTAVAAAASATIVAAVPANTASGTVLSATATSTSTTTDLTPANNTASTTTTVGTSSDVSVTITDAPDPVTAGTNLTYTVTVANAGPSDAQGVTASMATPAGTTLVSAPGPIGTLAAGASVQSTFVFTVTPAVLSGTVITGTATAASTTTDPNAANNTASTTTTVSAEANLAATLTASASAVLVNVPVTFSATSTNLGPSDAQNVVLAITLSPDFRYAGHTASAGAVCTTPQVGNSGVISCTWAGATAPNAVRTLDVSAFSNNDNQNTVSVATSSATTDPVAGNNAASVVVTVGFLIEEIPSLNGLGLVLLGLMLGLVGFVAVRRQA